MKLVNGTLAAVEWDEETGDTLLTYRVEETLSVQRHEALILVTAPQDRCLYHKDGLGWDACHGSQPCIVGAVKDAIECFEKERGRENS